MRKILASLLLIPLLGCATSSAGKRVVRRQAPLAAATEADRVWVELLRTEVEALLAAQAEDLWLRWTAGGGDASAPEQAGGAGEEAGAAAGDGVVVEEHGPTPAQVLHSAETIQAVRRVGASSADPEERRALRFLEAFLVGEHLAARTAPFDGRIDELLRDATFETQGERHLVSELGALLARESDPGKRARIVRDASPIASTLRDAWQERTRLVDQVAQDLGYAGAGELRALVLGLDLDAVAALADDFLDQTESIFRQAFTEVVRRELGMSLGQLRRSDLPRLFRGVTFDARFPGESGWAAAQRTLADMGIGLDSLQSLRVDDAAHPEKVLRPACFPIDPPADVRLSIPAEGLGGDWRPLLRELGCVEHAAHMAQGRFEFRRLGYQASADAFARIFQGLSESPAWLGRHTSMTETEIAAQLAGGALQELFVLRRAAASFLFDRQRLAASWDVKELQLAYRSAMERAFLFPLGDQAPMFFLVGREGIFGAAPAFEAQLLASTVRARLEEAHGANWWEHEEAGAALIELWAEGNRSSPDELARKLGGPGLETAPLVRELTARLAPLLGPPPVKDEGPEEPEPPEGGPAVAVVGVR